MKKVICLGEILIDFVCNEKGCDLVQGKQFTKLAGGAPANVATCIAKLGGQSEFVGAVGKDAFGQYLVKTLQDFQVGTEHIQWSELSTTLAFVSRKADGDRDFQFFRGADQNLSLQDEKIDSLLNDGLLHLGSATALLGGNLMDSYLKAANSAKINGCYISFDPNFRSDLYPNYEAIADFKTKCHELFALADMVKVSEEECELLCEGQSLAGNCEFLHQLGVRIVLVTLGAKGCLVSVAGTQTLVPAYNIEVIDTTGAGDAFIGAMLFGIAKLSSNHISAQEIINNVRFAQKVSALVCTQIGAMTALPTWLQVNDTQLDQLISTN